MTRQLLGILGGTFNPVHWGHLRTARTLCEQFSFERLCLIPAAFPPHKNNTLVSFEHRLTMLKLATQQEAQLSVLDLEAQFNPSYTLHTVTALKTSTKNPLALIMGADAFSGFLSWHAPDEILSRCHIIVINRAGMKTSFSAPLQKLIQTHEIENEASLYEREAGGLYFKSLPEIAISSTEIRARVAAGLSISEYCPKPVVDYIKVNDLYSPRFDVDSVHHERGSYAH